MTTHLMATYGPAPRRFVSGSGSWLVDADGERYLDCLSGLAVTSLGHAHPEVAAAIAAQAGTLLHVSNLFDHPLREEVAATLDRLLGGGGQVFFCNSGAEANEAALKLARRANPGRPGVLATFNGFHGRTFGALAATGQPTKQAGFEPLPPGFSHVEFGDLRAAATALRAEPSIGALLVEVVQGEGGVVEASSDYLPGLRQLCDDTGVLLILDEVQTGLGRCGTWFAHQRDGVSPDVVTMAKALGNGMPVGACWARAEVAAAFQPGDHGTTFGGQPLALAAAKATLEALEALDAPAAAAARGAQLRAGLEAIPGVVTVRGRGLLLAAVIEGQATAVVTAALDQGLIVNAVRPDAVRFAPPLTISAAEVDEALVRFTEALRIVEEER